MKFLTDRQEIAEALNFMKYPVIVIDIGNPVPGWDNMYAGTPVRVDEERTRQDTPMYTDCEVRVFAEKGKNRTKAKILLKNYGLYLSAELTAEDILERARKAQAPVVKAGQTVVVVYKFRTDGMQDCMIKKMKMPDRISHGYSTVAVLEEVEE